MRSCWLIVVPRPGNSVAPVADHGQVGRREVQRWRLWCGCCEPYVLWEPSGDGIAIDDAPLSDALKDDLRQWRAFVEEHVGLDGWDSDDAEALHVRRARGLRSWLSAEFGEPVNLDVLAMRVGW